MDDSYFAEIDAAEIERIEDDPPPRIDDEDNAPPGPDEAVEASASKKVKPKKHIVNPRPKLDDKRLKSQRGLIALEPLFTKVRLKGKGHEVKDLNTVLSVLEHWAHRLFPRMTFDDALEKIEDLGHKKNISSFMTLLRMDSLDGQMEIQENEVPPRSRSPSPVRQDPFDQLIGQPTRQEPELTDEQRARIMRNRLLAEERRLARMKAKYDNADKSTSEQPENSNRSSSPIIGQTNLSDLSHLEDTPTSNSKDVGFSSESQHSEATDKTDSLANKSNTNEAGENIAENDSSDLVTEDVNPLESDKTYCNSDNGNREKMDVEDSDG